MNDAPALPPNAIAIVGMAGRFPGARSADELWQLVRDGREAIRRLTEAELRAAGVPATLIAQPTYVRAAATLDGMDAFDAGFFGFSPRDAAIMDPQHRHFLECAWEVLERAGYTPEGFGGSIGVFGGCGMQAYFAHNLLNNPELMASAGFFLVRHTGNDKDFLTTRVSYQLNLRGPSVSVQTACSTSLVAVHLACQSLLNRECDMALAGGVTIELPHGQGYLYEEGEILSPDGHCRAFDAASKGTVFGSGAGLVALRRLEDAIEARDHIHAVIIGSAVNNDGAGKVGYLAPSVDGQAAVIAEAIALAGIESDSITYVETHGTGTPVGDPIEIAALTEAFHSSRRQFCAIGSIKTNIGHLDTAAGVASLVKAVSAVEHGELPPSLHFEQPNPVIPFDETPFFVNARLQAWHSDGPRRAGVTSLGVGGTNAHIVIEEAPTVEARTDPAGHRLLLLSARSQDALARARVRLADHLRRHPGLSLADAAFTLHAGRRAFPCRHACAAESVDDAIAALSSPAPTGERAATPAATPALTFMFPGGGAQHPGMAAALYQSEPVFRREVDRCLTAAARHVTADLRPLLLDAAPSEDSGTTLEQPSLALPALFTIEYALAALLKSWGLQPDSFIGHSLGEYVAACLSGVMTLDTAIAVVAARARLFESLPPGMMISVPLAVDDVARRLSAELSIAAVNGPALCVVSGPVEPVERLMQELAGEGIETHRLRIRVAAHSRMLDPVLDEFRRVMRGVELAAPQIPFVSNVSGTWITTAQATDPDYWVTHLRQTVLFAAGISVLTEAPERLLVEVGPGTALSTLARLQAPADRAVSTIGRAADAALARASVLTAAGQLWMAGCPLDAGALHDGPNRRRVPLPTYPFEHQRYWIEPTIRTATTPASTTRDVSRWLQLPLWIESPSMSAIGAAGSHWLLCTDEPEGLAGLTATIEAAGGRVTTASTGGTSTDRRRATVDPCDPDSLRAAIGASTADDPNVPLNVVVAWSSANDDHDRPLLAMLALGKALADAALPNAIRLVVLTRALRPIGDAEIETPVQALAAGALRVLGAELPDVAVAAIDLSGDDAAALAQEGGTVATAIVNETLGGCPAPQVAIRAGRRWLPSLRGLPPSSTGTVRVRPGGVYVITGGLGGIALTIAEALATRERVTLVLVSRREMPLRSEWDDWIGAHPRDDERRRVIERIRAIEARGASVTIERGDIASVDDVGALIDRIRAAHGTIHGLVHAAGVLDDGLLTLKSPEEARRVLRPKVAGTLALDAALGTTELDFWINCSSVSAMLGLPGQIDYAAANAFLDAFSHWRAARDGGRTTTINWQAWRGVGMLAERRQDAASSNHEGWAPLEAGLLQRVAVSESGRVFAATLSPSADWVLDEHRLSGGEALLPGTAFLELAVEGSRHGLADLSIELQDMILLAPFRPGDSSRTLEVAIERATGDLVMSSGTPGQRVEHARATVRTAPAATRTLDLAALSARCRRPVTAPAANLSHLRVGSRWQGSIEVMAGEREVLVRAALPAAFAAESDQFVMHPALLDLVTAGSFQSLGDYVAERDFFVPLSYGRVTVHAALPAAVVAHVRPSAGGDGTSPDVAVIDVTVADPDGRVLVEIERFVARRMAPFASLDAPRAGRASGVDLSRAIAPEEGAAAFLQVLDSLPLVQVVVGPRTMDDLEAEAETLRTASRAPVPSGRTRLAPIVEPRDEIERQIAELWRDLLGTADVGIDDNFFEQGGHSLLLAQLGARLRRSAGVQVPIATLFERPTIRQIADFCRQPVEAVSDEPALVAVPRDRLRRHRATLGGG